METKVFMMGKSGTMERVDIPANSYKNNLPNGTVVRWTGHMAWPAQDFCIVGKTESTWGTSYQMISLDNYSDHQTEAYQIKEPTPEPCQDFVLTDKVLSSDEVLDLISKNKIKNAHNEEAQKLEAQRKEDEKKEHEKNYPYLTPLSKGGTASKNIKAELKRAFPSVKFSVRQDHSISVSWNDGPTVEEVKKITGKYEEGSFDGMTDCYNYDHRQTWTDVFGGDRYVFEYREVTNNPAV